MFADIVPIIRLPKRQRVFTYQIPDDWETLKPGTLVRAPWRSKTVDGIVVSTSATSEIKRTLTLLTRHEEIPSWTQAHLETFTAYAERLYCSYPDLASQFLPDVPKRSSAKVAIAPTLEAPATTMTLKPAVLEELRSALSDEKNQAQLLHANHASERIAFYHLLVRRHKGQVLILVPTKQDAEEIAASLKQQYAEEVLVSTAQTGKHASWAEWQAVRDATKRIIIATRSGTMLPCRSLSCIAIDQEERPEHAQWEAHPRYDARDIALSLAKKLDIPLWAISHTPRIQMTYAQRHILSSEIPPAQTIIHHTKNVLDDATEEAALECIRSGKSVLFVTPHKARARTLRCLDCQQGFPCPRCRHPLVEADDQRLHCPSCGADNAKPLACPRCKSLSIKSFGQGVVGLAEALRKYKSAPVSVIQSTTDLADIDLSNPQFIVSTPYTCKRILSAPHAPLGLVVLFHPEGVLFTPTHAANELYYRLIHWHRMFAQDYEGARFLVQSGLSLGHPLHTTIIQNDYAAFEKTELAQRKARLLPPFSTLILVSAATDDAHRQQTAEQITTILNPLKSPMTSVLGPRHVLQQKGAVELRWLIRTTETQRPNLDKTMNSVYNSCNITINPERSVF